MVVDFEGLGAGEEAERAGGFGFALKGEGEREAFEGVQYLFADVAVIDCDGDGGFDEVVRTDGGRVCVADGDVAAVDVGVKVDGGFRDAGVAVVVEFEDDWQRQVCCSEVW